MRHVCGRARDGGPDSQTLESGGNESVGKTQAKKKEENVDTLAREREGKRQEERHV